MLKRLSFRTNLLLGFTSLLLLMLGSILISLNYVEKMSESIKLIDKHPKTVLTAVRDIELNTFKIHNFMNSLLETNNEAKIDEFKVKINESDKNISTFITLLKDRYLGDLEDLSNLIKTYNDWKMIRSETILYVDRGDYSQAEIMFNSLGHDYIKLLSSKCEIIQDYALNKVKEHFYKIKSQKKANRNFLVYIVLLLFIFALAIAILISNSISKPIKKLINKTLEVHNIELDKNISQFDEQELLESTVNELNIYYDKLKTNSVENKENKKTIEEQLEKIQKQADELRTLNTELENKVLIRTEEVAKSFEELEENRDILKSYLDSSPDSIIVLDENAKFDFISNATFDLFGLGKDIDIKILDIFDFIDPVDKEKVGNSLNKLIKTGEATNPEIKLIRKNKTKLIVQTNSSLIKNKDGKLLILIIAHDITERNKMEERIIATNELLISVLDSSPIGIGLDVDRQMKEVNKKFCEIVGYSQDELIGKNSKFLYPSEEIFNKVGEEKYKQIQEKGTGFVETQLQRKDGAIIDVILRFTPLDINNLSKGVTFTTSDVTERQRTRKALIISEKKYRNMFENSINATLIIENSKFVDCNESTVNLLGYNTKNELLNTHPSELSPEKQPDGQLSLTKADEMIELALKNKNHRFKWDHKRSNGEVFPVEVTLTTLENEKGHRVLFTVWREI